MKNTNTNNGAITLQKTVGNKTIKASFDGEHIWVVNGEGGQTELTQFTVTHGRAGGYNKYKVVFLFGKSIYVHRIIASIFCPGEAEGKVVHHIDHDTFNNSADNLMWLTKSEHRKMHRGKKSTGDAIKWNWELHPKLRCYQAARVLSKDGKFHEFDSISKAAKWMGVNASTLAARFRRHKTLGEVVNDFWVELKKGDSKGAKPVVAIDVISGEETVYKSQYAAAKALGVSQGNLNRCLNYKPGHAYYMGSTGGYRFRYATKKEVA